MHFQEALQLKERSAQPAVCWRRSTLLHTTSLCAEYVGCLLLSMAVLEAGLLEASHETAHHILMCIVRGVPVPEYGSAQA